MIVVVDYGVGNLSSVANMLQSIGANVIISGNPDEILRADKIILPGVGSFDYGIERLETTRIGKSIHEFAMDLRRPVLGICLGAQIMGTGSEEGKRSGLGWINMTCKRFQSNRDLKVPHMRWNRIQVKRQMPLFDDLEPLSRFYFVHSYYMCCSNEADVIATSTYGHEFTCAFQHGNLIGVQFHPEKSHKYGKSILNAFAHKIF